VGDSLDSASAGVQSRISHSLARAGARAKLCEMRDCTPAEALSRLSPTERQALTGDAAGLSLLAGLAQPQAEAS
jgi:hypothetical protein